MFFLALLLFAAGAQAHPVRRLQARAVSDPEISQARVGALFQDRLGYVWIGARGRAFRYDGLTSVGFRVPGSSSEDSAVTTIAEDHAGNIWLGGPFGLAVIARGADHAIAVSLGVDLSVRQIVARQSGRIFAATNVGVVEIEASSRKAVVHGREAGLPSVDLSGLAFVDDRTIAIASARGAFVWDSARRAAAALPTAGSDPLAFNSIVRDGSGAVWAASSLSVHHWRQQGNAWIALKEPSWDSNAFNGSVYADSQGRVWIASAARRWLTRIDGSGSEPVRYAINLDPADQAALLLDESNMLWCANAAGGVNLGGLGSEGLQAVELGEHRSSSRDDRLSVRVTDLARGPRPNELWVGGATLRLLDVQTGDVRSFVHDARNPASVLMDDVHALHPSGSHLWVATHRGVDRLDPQSGKAEHFVTGQEMLDFAGQMFEAAGRLWVVGNGGLVEWDLRTRTFRRIDYGGPDSAIAGIVPVSGASFLLLTNTAIYEFRDGRFAKIEPTLECMPAACTAKPDLGVPNVGFTDALGRTWVGTSTGLWLYTAAADAHGRFARITAVPESVKAVAEDAAGLLWVAGERRLYRFDAGTRHAQPFDVAGIGSIATVGRDVFLGGMKGLFHLRPGAALANEAPPKLQVNTATVGNDRILESSAAWRERRLVVEPDKRSFTVELAALHFADPARNRYRYRLEGFDAGWIETGGTSRNIVYSNVPPGEYVLHAQAASPTGAWSPDMQVFSVTVRAPLWRRPWVQAGLALVLASALLLAYRLRVRALRRRHHELEALVARRTEEARNAQLQVTTLLHNTLPSAVADILIRGEALAPRRYELASVLFTDFVGFTATVATVPADRLVAELNEIFAAFDDIARRHGIEKIKTIGDAYMAVAGVPEPVGDHAHRSIRAALDMIAFMETRNRDASFKWTLRVGIHSGTVVAGVVGKSKYSYDVWGDTVNTASRLESAGSPGRVNVSSFTYDLVRDSFDGEYRGRIEVKGKGAIEMYFVSAR